MNRRAGRGLVAFILILLALGTVLVLVSGNNPFATGGIVALTTSGSTNGGAHTNADAGTHADTNACPDADTGAGGQPDDAARQLIVGPDPLDPAGQCRARPDLPQRTPDR